MVAVVEIEAKLSLIDLEWSSRLASRFVLSRLKGKLFRDETDCTTWKCKMSRRVIYFN